MLVLGHTHLRGKLDVNQSINLYQNGFVSGKKAYQLCSHTTRVRMLPKSVEPRVRPSLHPLAAAKSKGDGHLETDFRDSHARSVSLIASDNYRLRTGYLLYTTLSGNRQLVLSCR